MNIRKKLLELGDRFSEAWRVLVSNQPVTVGSLNSNIHSLAEKLNTTIDSFAAELKTTRAEVASQLQNQGLHAVAYDATAKSIHLQIEQLKKIAEHHRQMEGDRLKEIGDLRGFAWKVYSQNGEDGIIKEIFRRIGTTNKYFVEFGVESGVQCNTRYLAELLDWSGTYFEPADSHFEKLQAMWQPNPKVQTFHDAITSQNFESKLELANVPLELDLLVIDIDSNDYWVWKSLQRWRPRVVVVEYNAFHEPPQKWVMKENLDYVWNQTTYFGASFTSFYLLGKSKGYTLVGTDPMGVNMFFVRQDCMNDLFLDPALHFFFQPFGYTHPPSFDGPHEEI